jgi:hypothetical protein
MDGARAGHQHQRSQTGVPAGARRAPCYSACEAKRHVKPTQVTQTLSLPRVTKEGESSLKTGGLIDIYTHPPKVGISATVKINPLTMAKTSPLPPCRWTMVNVATGQKLKRAPSEDEALDLFVFLKRLAINGSRSGDSDPAPLAVAPDCRRRTAARRSSARCYGPTRHRN